MPDAAIARTVKHPKHGGMFLVIDLDEEPRKILAAAYALTGLNQAEFARFMGVSAPTLCFWLTGRTPVPTWAMRCAGFAAMMAGVAVEVPNPARYLSKWGKRKSQSDVT